MRTVRGHIAPALGAKLASPRRVVLLVVVCAALLSPTAANAAVQSITGNPLTVHLASGGNVQVQVFGQSSFSFYQPATTVGDAGLYLGLPVAAGSFPANSSVGPNTQAGQPDTANYTEVSQTAITGSGSAADPFTQVTKYNAGSGAGTIAEITQTTTYVNGQRNFRQKWQVKNVSGAALRFRASVGADLYLEGSDKGVGFFDAGPPRTVGGLSQTTGRAGGLREVGTSSWDAYQEATYTTIWNAFRTLSGLNNTINASQVDNGVGVQWDDFFTTGLASTSTATFETLWTFGIAGLTASPPSALLGKGSFHQVTFTATDENGALSAGKTVRYTITGVNPGSGAKTTAGNGQALVGWTGNNAGVDTITAYLDGNGNGTREANEPQAAANARFVDPALPGQLPAFALSGLPIVQNGVTTLVVVVPSAGRLRVQQAGASLAVASAKKKGKKKRKKKAALIKSVTLNPTKAGPVTVKIRPSKAGKKLLAKKGKFKVKVKITFTPKAGGKGLSFTKTIKMKGKKKSAHKRKSGGK
jgi:hypothetical protein